MELIKELGSRTTTTSTGKTTSRKWGLFKCPICLIEKEYNLQKGNVNKTCGSKGCRKELANYAPWNQGIADEDKIKNLPYYSSFSSYYRKLVQKGVSMSWKSLQDFRNEMYKEYAKIRATDNGRVALETFTGGMLTKDNCNWTTEYRVIEDFSADVSKGILHSRMLAKEIGIKHSIIARTLTKMDDTFGEYTYTDVTAIGNLGRPTKAYNLSKYQYNRLKDRLLDNIKRKISTSVYLIQCEGIIKIGVSHDVDKRFKVLQGSNPFPIKLLHSNKVTNALEVEKYLHNKYAEFNHHHEWFKLTDDQIKEIIAYIDIKNK